MVFCRRLFFLLSFFLWPLFFCLFSIYSFWLSLDVSKLFFFPSNIWGCLIFTIFAEHSTHFQVGGDNPKVEGGSRGLKSIRDVIPLNKFAKQSHILLSLWHFHFWKQSSRGTNVIRHNVSCSRLLWKWYSVIF